MAQRGKHSGAHFKQDPAPKRKRRDKGARQQQRHSSVQAPIPAQPPRVSVGVGDSVVVMGVRGLPRLTDRHEYTEEEIASATFSFSEYKVVG